MPTTVVDGLKPFLMFALFMKPVDPKDASQRNVEERRIAHGGKIVQNGNL